jgi:hypothetical protein
MQQGRVIGNEPLADGMHIAFRLRQDFTVTNAQRLLAHARAVYIELNPGTTEETAAAMVTCAADAIFTLLERDGVIGNAIDAALAAHADHGLALGGSRAQVTFNEPHRLPPGPRQDCFSGHVDVFALPADSSRS